MIDLRQSRRNKFITCEYWKVIKDKNISKPSELTYEKAPTGFFKASIIGNYTEENQTLENAFMYKKVTVVIETTDVVEDLEQNDIVRMNGELYRVSDLNRTPKSNQQQFSNRPSYTTVISLRR